jgi:hypothetical protein
MRAPTTQVRPGSRWRRCVDGHRPARGRLAPLTCVCVGGWAGARPCQRRPLALRGAVGQCGRVLGDRLVRDHRPMCVPPGPQAPPFFLPLSAHSQCVCLYVCVRACVWYHWQTSCLCTRWAACCGCLSPTPRPRSCSTTFRASMPSWTCATCVHPRAHLLARALPTIDTHQRTGCVHCARVWRPHHGGGAVPRADRTVPRPCGPH